MRIKLLILAIITIFIGGGLVLFNNKSAESHDSVKFPVTINGEPAMTSKEQENVQSTTPVPPSEPSRLTISSPKEDPTTPPPVTNPEPEPEHVEFKTPPSASTTKNGSTMTHSNETSLNMYPKKP